MGESRDPEALQDLAVPEGAHVSNNGSTTDDIRNGEKILVKPEWDWATDSQNPYNWPKWKKNIQLITIATIGFTWYEVSPSATVR